MSTAGPNSPGTLADDNAVGTLTWANPGNAASSNNSYATVDNAANNTSQSHYLKATNFGFAIPTGATVNGVTVTIERKASYSTTARYVLDAVVKLVKEGTVSGNSKADTTTKWPTADGSANYGGAADLWGVTLAPSDVNASTFGVVLSVNLTNGNLTTCTASVDAITITVTYTASGTTYNQSVTGSITPSGALRIMAKKVVAGSATPAGSVARVTKHGGTGSVTLSAGLIKRITRGLAGSTTPVGAQTRRAGKDTRGSVTLSSSTGKRANKRLIGGITSSGNLVRSNRVYRSGSFSPSSSQARNMSKGATGTITAIGNPSKRVGKLVGGTSLLSGALSAVKGAVLILQSLAGSLTLSGHLGRRVGKHNQGSVTGGGALQRRSAVQVTGRIEPSGALATIRAAILALTGSLTPTGNMQRSIGRGQTGELTLMGGLSKRVSKGLGRILTSLAGLVSGILGRQRAYVTVGDASINGLSLAGSMVNGITLGNAARGVVGCADSSFGGIGLTQRVICRVAVSNALA